jgi:hypothetical protein
MSRKKRGSIGLVSKLKLTNVSSSSSTVTSSNSARFGGNTALPIGVDWIAEDTGMFCVDDGLDKTGTLLPDGTSGLSAMAVVDTLADVDADTVVGALTGVGTSGIVVTLVVKGTLTFGNPEIPTD